MSNFARTTAYQRPADSGAFGASANHDPNIINNNNNNSARRFINGEKPPAYTPTPIPIPNVTTTSAPAAVNNTLPSSVLRPRIAVLLGISTKWQLLLFVCRLVSIVPGIWYGLPSVLRLLAMIHLLTFGRVTDDDILSGRNGQKNIFPFAFGRIPSTAAAAASCAPMSASGSSAATTSAGFDMAFETRLRLTETLLATIWCGASSYLSFFFTDCLMSRWLLNYTPIGTIIRLVAINAINGYATSWVLVLTGASEDPRLLLPSWILIATTLTGLYHLVHTKINIRKETRASISVFSIASFISMVALLAQLHSNRSDYGNIPLINVINKLGEVGFRLALRIMEYGNNVI
ncbi:N-glycosylation protein-domain-containing protein [Podospora fimiseda]|uniref:N-glycosylation protein-domain-containing protein n=1 Tax=Podospora fimiseda TaxID=252190 RepID=A0AAN7H8G0_9PEZI|nr:N-glycosylation protein-domain-containing protein [Podospora fimiseda]